MTLLSRRRWERAIAFRLLAKDHAVEVFEALPRDHQQSLIKALGSEDAAAILERLEADEGARLLDELPAAVAKRLLGELPAEDITTVYVTDARRRLVGMTTLPALIKAEPTDVVADHLATTEVHVPATAKRADAARLLAQYDLAAIPVVDDERRLIGSITYDDAIDVLEADSSQTMYAMAGLSGAAQEREFFRSEHLTKGSILYPVRVRVPFLLVALAGGLIVGGLIEFWEEALATLTVLAFFIPVIMDMGGNVGTQSSTIFARGLALGHIDPKRFGPQLAREVAVGASMAAPLGLVGGAIARAWQGIPELGLVVGVSLFAGLTIAAMLGFLLPWALYKLGFDHAPGADPFITTIKDFTALAIYFALAVALIPGVG